MSLIEFFLRGLGTGLTAYIVSSVVMSIGRDLHERRKHKGDYETKYGPYSPHRLEVATCGFSFYHRYISPESKTLVMERSVASDRGSAAHDVLERVTKALQKDRTYHFTDKELREWVTDSVRAFPLAYEEIECIHDMAKRYVRRPPDLHSEARTEVKLAVKWVKNRFEQCEYDDPAAIFRVRIDILDMSDDCTQVTIYDHKTQPNMEEADTAQMALYAWILWKIYPFLTDIKTVLHFSRYGTYSEPVAWTVEELEDIEANLMTQIDVVESRTHIEATPHKGCQYCPFLATCPVMADHVALAEDGSWQSVPQSLKILGSTAKAAQLAGLLNVAEALVKKVKEELKEHVKTSESPVAIPGKIYGFVESEKKVNWDMVNKSLRKETYQTFAKHGVDPKDFMGFSQTFSKQVVRLSNKQLLDDLMKIFPVTSDTEFRGRNV